MPPAGCCIHGPNEAPEFTGSMPSLLRTDLRREAISGPAMRNLPFLPQTVAREFLRCVGYAPRL